MQSRPAGIVRRRLDLRGQVQGVGFRPFACRLAAEFSLAGHAANNSIGAVVEIEGPTERVAAFEERLLRHLPPLARISELHRRDLEPLGEVSFQIRGSESDAEQRPEITPDAATCQDCLTELRDPADRRHRYPLINCTNCGPRYSIIRTVPYDRPATTMAAFEMCPPCAREYSDPLDRRFHAQPNACADCGPHLQLARVQPPDDELIPIRGDPIVQAARLLADGSILAVKGIGGYHLACRADCEEAVQRLRERKLRDGKPLAVMVPSEASARKVCRLSEMDLQTLASAAAPIVLAPKGQDHGLAPSIAPGCDTFGIMLPYAPLHHLLFAEGLGPLVMTSANLAGQPLTYRDNDAVRELREAADAFVVHNREIFRPLDDSVVFTFRGQAVPIRRARGYAPRPLRLSGFAAGGPLASVRHLRILAVGGEAKATVCLLHRGEAILSEHLGDLANPEAYRHFARAIERLKELFGFVPDAVACDLHPQYLSTQYARRLALAAGQCKTLLCRVQHHHAHIASVMAEWNEPGPVIGLACDGTGYGTDGAVWGCEVLRCERGEFERLGHLDYFPLVGANAAALETWRPAAALLRQAFGPRWTEYMSANVAVGLRAGRSPLPADLEVFEQQAAAGVNAPPTSSLGRVFDAVSFLLGLCRRNRHEAEAAMALEAAAAAETAQPYPYDVRQRPGGVQLSLIPTIAELVRARRAGEGAARSAARFHETVARMLAAAAALACAQHGVQTVALSGGCFANRRLLARLVELVEERRLKVLYHRTVPSGDGGLSLGQAVAAAWRFAGAELPSRGAGAHAAPEAEDACVWRYQVR